MAISESRDLHKRQSVAVKEVQIREFQKELEEIRQI